MEMVVICEVVVAKIALLTTNRLCCYCNIKLSIL